jgi:iron-sulfur cluster protein
MGRRLQIKRALKNPSLQSALKKASGHHFQKYSHTTAELPWSEIKEQARAIRRENVKRLPELIARFREEAEKAGARTYQASTAEEACLTIERICREKKARLVVKSKSMVSEEIGLNEHLEKSGFRVVETDLGEWIIQMAGQRPSHITAPALHMTKEDVAGLLSRHLGRPVPPDIRAMVRLAREELRRAFLEADVGISGANLAVAESGTLAIVSNEGNARLVTTLPPVHIALISVEKFVETLEQAVILLKALIPSSSGLKLTSYLSFITGPSKTTDIEKELVVGVHGPGEVHIIILDNGRLRAATEPDGQEALTCLKCGGCMLVCPVFQAVGGHHFGGPVYPGGIGALLTALTGSLGQGLAVADFCADCKKCEEFCPVGIRTGDLLLGLKMRSGPALWERLLSGLFRRARWQELGARLASFVFRPWTDAGLVRLPGIRRALPGFRFRPGRRAAERSSKRGSRKAYLFQGCLVKFFFPQVRDSVQNVLARFGFQVVCPEDQVCCGAPSLHLGCSDDLRRLADANLCSFEREGPEVILTVCPTGQALLKKVYPRLRPEAERWAEKVFDFTEFMVRRGLLPRAIKPDKEAFYHHPCHALYEGRLLEEPLKLLESAGYRPRTEEEPFTCCGFCGVFSLKNPTLSARFWKDKEKRIKDSGAGTVVTDCPGCLFQIKSRLGGAVPQIEVRHSAEILAAAYSAAQPETGRPSPASLNRKQRAAGR